MAQNTTYTIKTIVKGSSWTGTENDYTAATVTTGSCSDFTLTTAESNACSNHGATSTFTVARWNALVDKVSEVIGGKGWDWISNNSNQGATLSVANTKASSSDKYLYASMFNSLRYNIGSHYSTGIDVVQTGQIVYGAYFIGGTVNGSTITGLVPALNGLINSEQIHFTTD